MKQKRVDVLWGIALIVIGLIFLAQNTGFISEFAPRIWAVLFAIASLLFFIGYFSSRQRWGLLFPATALGAIAAIIWLAERGADGPYLGSLFLWAISLPFWVIFATDRQQNWWALIPGWATAVIGFIILLSDRVEGDIIGALVMLSIALPFFVIYLARRQQSWALIPGFILAGISLIILLATRTNAEWIGALVLFVIALPFFFIYARQPKHWWALIPAGVMTSIGVTALLAINAGENTWQAQLAGGVMFLGMALTFAALWLQRAQKPTAWAKYPAIGLGIFALLVLVLGEPLNDWWPFILIALGVWLLFDNRRPKLQN